MNSMVPTKLQNYSSMTVIYPCSPKNPENYIKFHFVKRLNDVNKSYYDLCTGRPTRSQGFLCYQSQSQYRFSCSSVSSKSKLILLYDFFQRVVKTRTDTQRLNLNLCSLSTRVIRQLYRQRQCSTSVCNIRYPYSVIIITRREM